MESRFRKNWNIMSHMVFRSAHEAPLNTYPSLSLCNKRNIPRGCSSLNDLLFMVLKAFRVKKQNAELGPGWKMGDASVLRVR